MEPNVPSITWPWAVRAVARAWKPLVAYEILASSAKALVLGPLVVSASYRLIELAGDGVLGNSDLAWFLLSPLGFVALVLVLGASLGLMFVEYAGLMLLVRAALRGGSVSVSGVLLALAKAAPRLFTLAIVQTACAALAALPFLGLAALTWWLLISKADINYYLSERPPRFWVAAGVGVLLALGLAASTTWFFLRWAFAVPALVLDGQSVRQALRSSRDLMRGRGVRLLAMLIGWLLLEQVALVAAVAGLDRLNGVLFSVFDDRLTLLVGSTLALLVVDAILLQLVATVFAVGRALLITLEYEQAWQAAGGVALAEPRIEPTTDGKARLARAAMIAVLLAVPAASLIYAIVLAKVLVEYRPTRVTAHRAGSSLGPENSLAALRASLAAGTDDVEIDVQQTADGEVILMHDRDLRRTAGDPRDVGEVTLAEVAQLRLRDASGATDERIPMLDEFLEACDDRVRLNIELKETSRAPELPLAVVEVVRRHGFTDRAGVSCFERAPLAAVRAAEPRMPVGMIFSAAQGDLTRLPVDFLSLQQRMVTGGLLRRAHARGLEVHAWGVNDRETAVRLLDLGCDNLITANPVPMREVVDWYAGLGDAQRLLLRLRRWMRE
jgi:glycerophosphoryl diester phosphodiesterase